MSRITFSQILQKAGTDIRREYDRLYSLFFLQPIPFYGRKDITLRGILANSFLKYPFRGTCISLSDFDNYHGFHFEKEPNVFSIDYLVSFCEYSYNLVDYDTRINYQTRAMELNQATRFYLHQVKMVIEVIGYKENKQDGITDFVPKDQAAISVAEIIDPNLSYRVIEYNHHSMKGDLERKKAILLVLADKLEPQRPKLKQINASLESDLSLLLNNINVRHNNKEPGKNYKPYVASMKDEDIEKWYDDLYQMILLAFLELDHLDRKGRIDQLEDNLKKK